MAALGINPGFLLIFGLYFLLVIFVMTRWVYDPVIKFLEARKEKIAQGLEDARIASEARANAEKEATKIVGDAQAEANKRVAEATERAEKVTADLRAAAEEERNKIILAAREDAAQERNRILADLRTQVAALAIAAANKVIGQALDEQRQHVLIQEFFSGVRGGKFTVLDTENISGSANSVEVTSALPLTNDEQEAVRRDIVARLGGSPSVVFRVDPNILGGIVIRVGDKVVDASVAGRLEGLRASLH
jgi:F-type H+-transporting ATPase subunit b